MPERSHSSWTVSRCRRNAGSWTASSTRVVVLRRLDDGMTGLGQRRQDHVDALGDLVARIRHAHPHRALRLVQPGRRGPHHGRHGATLPPTDAAACGTMARWRRRGPSARRRARAAATNDEPPRTLTERDLNRALLARQLLLERSKLSIERRGRAGRRAPDAVRPVGLRRAVDAARELRTRRPDSGPGAAHGDPGLADPHDDPHRLPARVLEVRGGHPPLPPGVVAPRPGASPTSASWRRSATACARRSRDGPRTVKELDELAKGFIGTLGLWVDLVRVPPSGTWERRRADRLALADDWVGPEDATEDEGLEHLVRAYLRRVRTGALEGHRVLGRRQRRRRSSGEGERSRLVPYRTRRGASSSTCRTRRCRTRTRRRRFDSCPTGMRTCSSTRGGRGSCPNEHRPKVFSTKNPFSVGVVPRRRPGAGLVVARRRTGPARRVASGRAARAPRGRAGARGPGGLPPRSRIVASPVTARDREIPADHARRCAVPAAASGSASAVLTLACLVYVMDLTVLHLAVPAISRDLRPSSVELLWIIDIYGFMVAGFLITMGTLGDRIGRRRVLLTGAAAFGAASVLAAFSPTAEMLILSRALLGIAGATIAPSTLSLIFAMFEEPSQRSPAVGGLGLGVLGRWRHRPGARRARAGAVLVGLGVPPRRAGHGRPADPRAADPARVPGPDGRPPRPRRASSCRSWPILAIIFGLKQVAQDGPGLCRSARSPWACSSAPRGSAGS